MTASAPSQSCSTASSTSLSVPGSSDDLAAWLRYVESLHTLGIQGIELGLTRCVAVARALQLRLACPCIVVAGTNGKGSTCAMLESIYKAAGYRTAVYSSPHLIDFTERLRLSGHPVGANQLATHMAAVEAARGAQALTYFEFTTLAILHAIQAAHAAHQVDVAILEIGLGGRLDAVNIVDADCAIITNVDLDHMEFLGATVDKIALEKAGVMRAGRPVVVGDAQAPQALRQHADRLGARLWWAGQDYFCTVQTQQWRFDWRLPHATRDGGAQQTRVLAGLPHPALRGGNQLSNAAAALCAVQCMQTVLPTSAGAMRQGLALVTLAGRFQVQPGQPITVFDVAHNPHAARALQHNLDAMGYYAQTACVLGAMADKDIAQMLQALAPVIDYWFFCPLSSSRAASPDHLLHIWHSLGLANAIDKSRSEAGAMACGSVAEALTKARAQVGVAGRVVVCGSFYTVAQAWQ